MSGPVSSTTTEVIRDSKHNYEFIRKATKTSPKNGMFMFVIVVNNIWNKSILANKVIYTSHILKISGFFATSPFFLTLVSWVSH